MTKFEERNIEQLTLGERLKKTRQELAITLEKAARQTKIRKEYLKFLEEDNYNQLPSLVFVKNYLKVYSAYLGLDWSRLQKYFTQEVYLVKTPPTPKKVTTHFSQKALVIPKFIYPALVILTLVLLFTYLGWQINNFLTPPPLNLESPADDLTIPERSIEVKGQTIPEAHVLINGQEIAVDKAGNFQEVISLQSGFNNIQISAKTKHSKEHVIYKQIIVEEENNNN